MFNREYGLKLWLGWARRMGGGSLGEQQDTAGLTNLTACTYLNRSTTPDTLNSHERTPMQHSSNHKGYSSNTLFLF